MLSYNATDVPTVRLPEFRYLRLDTSHEVTICGTVGSCLSVRHSLRHANSPRFAAVTIFVTTILRK